MNKLEIRTGSSYGDLAFVQIILSAPGVKVREVELNTHGQVPREDAPSTEWPLIIRCSSDNPEARRFELRVFDLTSGYGGKGPGDLVECLKACKIDFDEDEIYTFKRIQRIYQKN